MILGVNNYSTRTNFQTSFKSKNLLANNLLKKISEAKNLDELRKLRYDVKGMPYEVQQAYVAREQKLRSQLSPAAKSIRNSVLDCYDPEEIREAIEHGGVFREVGEDYGAYSKRAREANEAWERAQKRWRN